MAYRIVSEKHRRVAADGQATIVAFDHKQACKATFPDVLRERIQSLQGDLPA
jgi:acyl-CoA thioester hydrolase